MIKFFKKKVGSSPTFPAKNFGVVMGFPLFDYPLIIHSATALSIFFACSWALSSVGMFIFLQALGCQGFLLSDSSLLLLLLLSSSPPPPPSPLLGSTFLKLSWLPVSFPFLLSGLLDPSGNKCSDSFFWVLCSGISSVSPSSYF